MICMNVLFPSFSVFEHYENEWYFSSIIKDWHTNRVIRLLSNFACIKRSWPNIPMIKISCLMNGNTISKASGTAHPVGVYKKLFLSWNNDARIRTHYEKLLKFGRVYIIWLKEAGWANRRIACHMGRNDAVKAIRRCWQKWMDKGRF